MPDTAEFLDFAKGLAVKAGQTLMPEYGATQIRDVIKEGNKGLLTDADISSDVFIREAVGKAYPGHGIFTEELGRTGHREYEWVVDPLDGTNNFRRGKPCWSVSIGLQKKGVGILGVVFAPMLNELYFASEGQGAYLRDSKGERRIHVSGEGSKEMFTFSFATGIDFKEPVMCDRIVAAVRNSGLFSNLRRRMLESTAYELCCVADGGFDAHFNNFAQLWDIAAGEVIVKEAGGKVTHFEEDGREHGIVLASNSVIHDKLAEVIRKQLK